MESSHSPIEPKTYDSTAVQRHFDLPLFAETAIRFVLTRFIFYFIVAIFFTFITFCLLISPFLSSPFLSLSLFLSLTLPLPPSRNFPLHCLHSILIVFFILVERKHPYSPLFAQTTCFLAKVLLFIRCRVTYFLNGCSVVSIVNT